MSHTTTVATGDVFHAPSGQTVNTVLGPVAASEMGVVAVQEALLSVLPGAQYAPDISMDRAEIFEALAKKLTDFREHEGIDFHALRTRQAGSRAFVSVHVLVPGAWTVQHGHDLVERVEDGLRAGLPHATIFTPLEPVEDPKSFADTERDRTMRSHREPGL